MRQLNPAKRLRIGRWELIPVEATDVSATSVGAFLHASGTKKLFAIVVESTDGRHALDANGDAMSIAELTSLIPELGG